MILLFGQTQGYCSTILVQDRRKHVFHNLHDNVSFSKTFHLQSAGFLTEYTVKLNLFKYDGAILFEALYVSQRTLYLHRRSIGNQ